MDTNGLFSNGLPEELEKLQSGQMYIFTSSYEGATEKYIRVCQYIASLCKQNKIKEGQKPAIFIQPTENPELWEHIFCLVDTAKGTILEIADVGSLTELVYDFLGLDFNSMPKPVVAERYQAYGISIAEHHPLKVYYVPNPTDLPEDGIDEATSPDSTSMSFGFIYAVGKEPTSKQINRKIEKLLWEADAYDVKIDLNEILKNFKAAKRKNYSLGLDIEKKEKKGESFTHIKRCDIYLMDEKGEKHIVKLEAQEKSVYLAFMLYNEGKGIRLKDLYHKTSRQEFEVLLETIHQKMVGRHELENYVVDKKMINEIRSRIKRKIENICMNLKVIQNFLIEGEKEGLFRIAATTPNFRKEIKEKFEIV